jgi:activator of 2-hydroxyglutaryl-CoA dehydratase
MSKVKQLPEIDPTRGKTVVSGGVVGNNRVMTIPVSGILGRDRLSRPMAHHIGALGAPCVGPLG